MSDVDDVPVEVPRETHADLEGQTPIHRYNYDPSVDGELATFLVMTVAKARGNDPLDTEALEELPPIHHAIDATAVERLFFGSDCGETLRNEIRGAVTFPYAGYLIHLQSEGIVSVYESG